MHTRYTQLPLYMDRTRGVRTNSLVYLVDQGVVRTFSLVYKPASLCTYSLERGLEKGLLRTQYLFIARTNSLMYRLESHVHNLHTQVKMLSTMGFEPIYGSFRGGGGVYSVH